MAGLMAAPGRLLASSFTRWGAAAAGNVQWSAASGLAGQTQDEQGQPPSSKVHGPPCLVPSSSNTVASKPGSFAFTPAVGKLAGSMFSSKPQMLRGMSASLPGMGLAAPQLMQHRSYHAWTPAQRYFVEGDHVIQAEINRTMQFTGLDAGSFYPFILYTILATVIASAFVVIPFVVAPARVDLEKSSAYECGFDAFGEARQTFSVSFYLVSIMYLLFDIEIAYLFPYVMTHANTPMFWTMNLFLSILVAGFVYEWGVGALEWRDSDAH